MNRQFGVPTLMNFNAHLYAGRRVCVNSVMLVVSCEAMDNDGYDGAHHAIFARLRINHYARWYCELGGRRVQLTRFGGVGVA